MTKELCGKIASVTGSAGAWATPWQSTWRSLALFSG